MTSAGQSAGTASRRGCLVPLPGGYLDETGVLHIETELMPFTGRDEEQLSCLSPDTPAAVMVTELLTRHVARIGTVQSVTQEHVRDMLVDDRDFLILKLRELTFGKRVDAVFYCPSPNCGKPMDVTFSLNDIEIRRAPVSARFLPLRLPPEFCDVFCEPMEYRLPTGGDQEAVAEIGRADEEKALRLLLARCLRSSETKASIDDALIAGLSVEAVEEIERIMHDRAPHFAIEPEATCPECGTIFVAPFDMASFFLNEARPDLRRLERDVHVLARYYHWSEQDILALPLQKRQRYLHLIQEEFDAYAEV